MKNRFEKMRKMMSHKPMDEKKRSTLTGVKHSDEENKMQEAYDSEEDEEKKKRMKQLARIRGIELE